jgi:hypothetical protein
VEAFGALYHWSPVERRIEILQQGLVPYARPCVHGESMGKRLAFPYVCLAPTPSGAWSLSADTDPELRDEFEGWDLWQVRLADYDSVSVLPQWGAVIREVRVRTAIPADRLWYVATRTGLAAIDA